MILAQRLGVSRYHSIKTAEEDDIKYINRYGGKSQRLFGEDTTNHAHSLIWIEDVEDIYGQRQGRLPQKGRS